MRWKVKSVDKIIDKKKGTLTKTETKQLMITIGDAIGVGKNAYGAIKGLTKTLPSLAISLPHAGLQPFVPAAGILGTIIKGLDIYKKVMKVVETVTPLVQVIARASGAWCSPGNIGDIAQIVLGQVQKILISLAISGILKLKEWIWNYEFSLMEIKSVFTDSISKNMEDLLKKMPIPNPTTDLNNLRTKNTKGYGDNSSTSTDSDTDTGNGDDDTKGLGGDGTVDLGEINWERSEDFNFCSSAYITEYTEEESKYKRLLRGNLRNLGIQYSDDNGETWNETEQKIGSWGEFAKIKIDDNYIYVAGGVDCIKSIKKVIADKEEENYFYSDDKIKTFLEYGYDEKKRKRESYEEAGIKLDFIKSLGIYYSTDNGINWISSNIKTEWINNLCEFKEKVGSKATIVAGSNDWHGCYYTENGIYWYQSDIQKGRWLQIESYRNTFKIVHIKNIDNVSSVGKEYVNIGKENKFKNIYQKFEFDKMEIEKRI